MMEMMEPPQPSIKLPSVLGWLSWAWNNGKEVPRWGVAVIQKMSPSTTGRCSRHAAAVLSNKGVEQPTNGSAAQQHGSQSHGLIIFDIQEKLF